VIFYASAICRDALVARIALSWVMGLVAAVQIPGCSVRPFEVEKATPTADASAAAGGDFRDCLEYFPGFVPRIPWPGRQRAPCFDSFAVLHSGESKTALYSVERLTRDGVSSAKTISGQSTFTPRPGCPLSIRPNWRITAEAAMTAATWRRPATMPTDVAKAQSFSLANMVPQDPELNQHACSQIEQATRK
jgi:endonuclease G